VVVVRLVSVDELLLDWVPRKVSLSEPEIETLPGSVSEVLRFLGAAGRLPEPLARSLSRRADSSPRRASAAAVRSLRISPRSASSSKCSGESCDRARWSTSSPSPSRWAMARAFDCPGRPMVRW